MIVNFRTYCGLAGDLQELLIATTETGLSENTLISRTGFLKNYKKEKVEKKLTKKLLKRINNNK